MKRKMSFSFWLSLKNCRYSLHLECNPRTSMLKVEAVVQAIDHENNSFFLKFQKFWFTILYNKSCLDIITKLYISTNSVFVARERCPLPRFHWCYWSEHEGTLQEP